MGWWSQLFKKRAEDWIFASLDTHQVPNKLAHQAIQPETAYLSIFLQSIRVVHVRKGLSRFYGTVHSFTSLPHLSGRRAEFNVLTTPAKLKDVDASRVDRVIQVSQRLLGPIPYRGGDLELEVGLFSIKSADFAAPFLAVLEKLSTLAGVSYVNAALAFAEPLKDGINLLTGGADDTILEIGVAADFARPETGYFVVMRAPKGSVDVSKLKVDPADYRLVDQSNEPVRDYPYMILKIEATAERNDWFMIPEIKASYDELREQIRKGRFKEAEESLIVFKRMVLTSNDLLASDAAQLYTEVEKQAKAALGTTATRAGAERRMPDLNEISLYPS